MIYTTQRSASTTRISLRATPPTKISGRTDDQALDRHLSLVNEEGTALQKEIEAPKDPYARPISKAVEIGGSAAGYLRKRLVKPMSDELERQMVETLLERLAADTV